MNAFGPRWYALALTFLGEREIPGREHNPKIVQWWTDIRSKIRDDETPYCAAFAGAMLERSGIVSTRSPAARSYCNYGAKLTFPVLGCIVVFERPPHTWSGHVGFVAGEDNLGNIMTLGANQSNAVTIAPFARRRAIAYRWPPGETYPTGTKPLDLPVLVSTRPLSTIEA